MSYLKTVGERLAKLQEPDWERDKEIEILKMLPPDMERPTVTVFKRAVHLSWTTYDYSQHDNREILQRLLDSGFTELPATLCRWGDYRKSVYPGWADDSDNFTYRWGGDVELKEVVPIAPVWITLSPHTGATIRCFMEAPDSTFCEINLHGYNRASNVCHVHARRKEMQGEWYYERGSAKVSYPDVWHAIQGNGERAYACVSSETRGYVDTEQGISGYVYFDILCEQGRFPWTVAQFVGHLGLL